MLEDPKSAKQLLDLTVFFALSESAGIKAARRMLTKLTPEINDTCCTGLQYTDFEGFCTNKMQIVFVISGLFKCNFAYKCDEKKHAFLERFLLVQFLIFITFHMQRYFLLPFQAHIVVQACTPNSLMEMIQMLIIIVVRNCQMKLCKFLL